MRRKKLYIRMRRKMEASSKMRREEKVEREGYYPREYRYVDLLAA